MITIDTEKMSEIFTKHHLRNLPFDAVIHHFTAPDEGDPHDHPFSFNSHILKGGYKERVYYKATDGRWKSVIKYRLEGESHKVYAKDIHQIIELFSEECWTIITPGKWERKPGFWRFDESGAKFREWDQSEFKTI